MNPASKILSVFDSESSLPPAAIYRPAVIFCFAALMAAVVVYKMTLEAKVLSNHMVLSTCLLQTFFVHKYGYEAAL